MNEQSNPQALTIEQRAEAMVQVFEEKVGQFEGAFAHAVGEKAQSATALNQLALAAVVSFAKEHTSILLSDNKSRLFDMHLHGLSLPDRLGVKDHANLYMTEITNALSSPIADLDNNQPVADKVVAIAEPKIQAKAAEMLESVPALKQAFEAISPEGKDGGMGGR